MLGALQVMELVMKDYCESSKCGTDHHDRFQLPIVTI